MPEVDKTIEDGKIWAFVGYWWILFLVPLLGKKDNKFASFHGKQGLVLFVFWVAVFIPILAKRKKQKPKTQTKAKNDFEFINN